MTEYIKYLREGVQHGTNAFLKAPVVRAKEPEKVIHMFFPSKLQERFVVNEFYAITKSALKQTDDTRLILNEASAVSYRYFIAFRIDHLLSLSCSKIFH